MNKDYNYTYKSTKKTSLAKFDVDFFKQPTGTVPGDVFPSIYSAFSSFKTWTVPPIASW